MDKISDHLKKIDILPTSPAILPKLAQTLNNIKNTDVNEIVDIIVFDSALTARLLKMANSAYFGNANPITSVGEAISQVGYDVVFMLAASISGKTWMKTAPETGMDAVLLWKHSVNTAFGAQHVARACDLDGNLAFTAGLLHDLGKMVFAETYGKNYTNMFYPSKRGASTLVEWEMDHYGCNHAEVGATLLENWKLPKPLVAAVKYHHQPDEASENAPLAASVCLGNALARTFDDAAFVWNPGNPEVNLALKMTRLTPNDLAEQWSRIRQKWEFVQLLYDLRK